MNKTCYLLFFLLLTSNIIAQNDTESKNYFGISLDKKIIVYETNFDQDDPTNLQILKNLRGKEQSIGIENGFLVLSNANDYGLQASIKVNKLYPGMITALDDWEIETRIEYVGDQPEGIRDFAFNGTADAMYVVEFSGNENTKLEYFQAENNIRKNLYSRYQNYEGVKISEKTITLRKQGKKLHLYINKFYECSIDWYEGLANLFGYITQNGKSIKVDYLRIYKISKDSNPGFIESHIAATYNGINIKKTIVFDDTFDDNRNEWRNKISKGCLVLKGLNSAERKLVNEDVPDFEFETIMLGDPTDRIFDIYGENPASNYIEMSLNGEYRKFICMTIKQSTRLNGSYCTGVIRIDENTPSKFTIRKYDDIWYFFYNEELIYVTDEKFIPVNSVKLWSFGKDKVLVDRLTFSKFSR